MALMGIANAIEGIQEKYVNYTFRVLRIVQALIMDYVRIMVSVHVTKGFQDLHVKKVKR